jgi:hypothetical protein
VVSVAGIGGRLSGNYVVSRVNHRLTDSSYTQKFAHPQRALGVARVRHSEG